MKGVVDFLKMSSEFYRALLYVVSNCLESDEQGIFMFKKLTEILEQFHK